jgi:hypothetical protein
MWGEFRINKQLRSAVSNTWPTSSFYVVLALFLFKLQKENCLSVKQFISFLRFKIFIRKERNEGGREGEGEGKTISLTDDFSHELDRTW